MLASRRCQGECRIGGVECGVVAAGALDLESLLVPGCPRADDESVDVVVPPMSWTVYVPPLLMHATSPVPGTAPLLQSAAVLQL